VDAAAAAASGETMGEDPKLSFECSFLPRPETKSLSCAKHANLICVMF
jgi:hypothetical protein